MKVCCILAICETPVQKRIVNFPGSFLVSIVSTNPFRLI